MTLQTREPENFRSRRWGAERRVSRAQTWERGPPSARAEFVTLTSITLTSQLVAFPTSLVLLLSFGQSFNLLLYLV